MTMYGITGHMDLTAETERLVGADIDRILSRCMADLRGVSILAEGADQIFARRILDHLGKLDVIVPCEQYPSNRDPVEAYWELRRRASRVSQLPFPEDGANAHMAASVAMVERCGILLAVWDGQPARSFGGTADVVAYAREIERPVLRVWPAGSARRPAADPAPIARAE